MPCSPRRCRRMSAPRILILTASFGDGHNSAARGLAAALQQRVGNRYRIEIRDFIRETQPLAGRCLERLYYFSITHAPWTWRQFYRAASVVPPSADPGLVLKPLARALISDLRADPPAAIAATFPLYPHLLRPFHSPGSPPLFTVVTDSITIHPIWRCPGVRAYFAPDEISAEQLRREVGNQAEVFDTGFAVSPTFEELHPEPPGLKPQRVLVFPSASPRLVRRMLASLFAESPSECCFTLVLGRHTQRLTPEIAALRSHFPARQVEVLGWVSNIPELMTSHDLIIAKAGGATTHECGAAGRPVILTKVVPGQEEGNAELLQRRGSGLHEDNPEEIGPLLRQLITSREWLRLRDAAWKARRANGAREIVGLLMTCLTAPSPADT